MGIDAGFDMVPRLSKGMLDRQKWDAFIATVKTRYKDDKLVEVKPNYIEFHAGEHPRLPFEGHKLLRFSSNISGSHAEGVYEYILAVTQIAESAFGTRVQRWDESVDRWGIYGWQEVKGSFKTYEQPDEPEVPNSIAESEPVIDPVNESDQPLFEVQDVPGQGKGLVARSNIPKGKRILVEKPFFTIRSVSKIGFMESAIAAKLRALKKAEQRQFLSLHNNFPGKHPFGGVVRTNGLPCGPGSPIGGVYPTISRVNHSCLSNAHHNWNDETECQTIHAIRDIKPGEEITISYILGGCSDTRRADLEDSFGFDCDCNLCSLPSSDLLVSDERRLKIQALDEAIGNPVRFMKYPSECLQDCRHLLVALADEYKDAGEILIARANYDDFQVCISQGDEDRARVFAERAYKSRVVCEGEDSPGAQKVKRFMEDPAQHPSFGASSKWKTSKPQVPQEVDTDEFTEWLWAPDGGEGSFISRESLKPEK